MATHSHLENPLDRRAQRATVHGLTQSRTWLRNRGLEEHPRIRRSPQSPGTDTQLHSSDECLPRALSEGSTSRTQLSARGAVAPPPVPPPLAHVRTPPRPLSAGRWPDPEWRGTSARWGWSPSRHHPRAAAAPGARLRPGPASWWERRPCLIVALTPLVHKDAMGPVRDDVVMWSRSWTPELFLPSLALLDRRRCRPRKGVGSGKPPLALLVGWWHGQSAVMKGCGGETPARRLAWALWGSGPGDAWFSMTGHTENLSCRLLPLFTVFVCCWRAVPVRVHLREP